MVEGTAQRLDELQRLSEQADKGEWFVASRDNDDEGWWIWTTDQYDAPYTLALAAYDGGFENDGQRIERDEANTQFVAALVNAYRAGDLVSSESLRGQADALQAAQLERDSAMASLARGEAIHAEALAGWSTTEAALQAATDARDRAISAYEAMVQDFAAATLRGARMVRQCREVLDRIKRGKPPRSERQIALHEGITMIAEEMLRLYQLPVTALGVGVPAETEGGCRFRTGKDRCEPSCAEWGCRDSGPAGGVPMCACGKPLSHVDADPGSAEWPCRVPDPTQERRNRSGVGVLTEAVHGQHRWDSPLYGAHCRNCGISYLSGRFVACPGPAPLLPVPENSTTETER